MCKFCAKSDKNCKKLMKKYYFFTKCAIIWVSERTKEDNLLLKLVNDIFFKKVMLLFNCKNR